MCLVSKVKFLCGRCGSPAVRLRQPRKSMQSIKHDGHVEVVTSQPISSNDEHPKSEHIAQMKQPANITSKDLNLALTKAIGEVARKVQKKGNKFTDGLDLSLTTDWANELRPSMKKLRQGMLNNHAKSNIIIKHLFLAMDILLKTARIIHSVQRLQQDTKKTSSNLAIMFRRDVCFSQAVRMNCNHLRVITQVSFLIPANNFGECSDGEVLGNSH